MSCNTCLLLYVIKELLTNPIKHHKGPTHPRVDVSVVRERQGWTVSFQDNGPGIDKFFAQQVFAIYQRLSGKPDETGTGIGLPICKKIIEEQHNGRIGFESMAGNGATFFFRLPENG